MPKTPRKGRLSFKRKLHHLVELGAIRKSAVPKKITKSFKSKVSRMYDSLRPIARRLNTGEYRIVHTKSKELLKKAAFIQPFPIFKKRLPFLVVYSDDGKPVKRVRATKKGIRVETEKKVFAYPFIKTGRKESPAQQRERVLDISGKAKVEYRWLGGLKFQRPFAEKVLKDIVSRYPTSQLMGSSLRNFHSIESRPAKRQAKRTRKSKKSRK